MLARGIHAAFWLIRQLGHPVYPSSKRLIDRSPAPVVAAMLWSLSHVRSFRELLATGKAESVALIDAMVASAPLAGRPVDISAIEAMKPS